MSASDPERARAADRTVISSRDDSFNPAGMSNFDHVGAQAAPAKRRIRPLLQAALGQRWAGFRLEGISRLGSRLRE